MDKFVPGHINGWKRSLDDLYFLEDNYRGGFKSLFDHFGTLVEDGFILTGCDATQDGDDYLISSGYIVIQGEILKVDAHTAVGPLSGGHQWHWQITEVDDLNSQSSDFDEVTFYKVKTRRAVVVAAATIGSWLPMECDTFIDKIRSEKDTDWVTVTLPAPYTGEMKYRLENGMVRLRGNINTNGGAPTLNLPTGYRPDYGLSLPVVLLDNPNSLTTSNLENALATYLVIGTNGNISIQSSEPGLDYKLMLDGVPPFRPA